MRKYNLALVALLLAACTQAPAPEIAVVSTPATGALAPPASLVPVAPEPMADPVMTARTALPKPSANSGRAVMFVYSDGVARRRGLGLAAPAPKGLASDAPADFMLPLKPGAQATYHIGTRAKDGHFTPGVTVTCRAGRIAQTNSALGVTDSIMVDCRGGGTAPLQIRSLYSPSLGAVLRQEGGANTIDLVALRPVTGDWPAAARTGLDWALTHQLESPPGGAPAQWSSTGVAAHFEIRATGVLTGRDAMLEGKYAAAPCRRFELIQSGARFPGIACQDRNGWSLPGGIRLAAPASGITQPAILRSAQK